MTQAVRNKDVTHRSWQCDCGSGHFVSIAQYLSDPEDAPTYFMFKNYQVVAEWPILSRLKRLAEVLKWALTGRGGHHLHWGGSDPPGRGAVAGDGGDAPNLRRQVGNVEEEGSQE